MLRAARSALILTILCIVAPIHAQQVSPQDLDSALKNVKAAETAKDSEAIKKTAIECFDLAAKAIKTPKPTVEAEVAEWTTTVAYAKEVQAYAEYALDVLILRTTESQPKVDYFETLEKNRPNSQYLPQLYPVMLGVYANMKPDRSFQFAQRAIAKSPKDEDLLLVLANGSYERKQYDSAANFGTRLVAALGSHPRPEGVPTPDWERRRSAMLGRGYWLAGMAFAAQNKYPQAIENLKASLPFVKDEPMLLAGAQFYIGVGSYNMARVTRDKPMMRDALKYSELAASVKSTYQGPAQQNVYAIKQEMLRMR